MDWKTVGRIGAGIATGGASELAIRGYDALSSKGPPGVGGPIQENQPLPSQRHMVQDPQTGFWFDPTTGQTYTDQTGHQVVKDPNVAQQVAANFAASRGFMNNLAPDRGMLNDAYAGQTNLAGSLDNTINNPNATSVAGSQLVSGMDALGRTQLANASGVGGGNAAAARRTAAMNIGQAGADLNQQKAGLRAQEVSAAQGRMGEVLGLQAAEGQKQYALDADAAGNFATLANTGAGGDRDAKLKSEENNQKFVGGMVNGGTGAAAKMI